MNKIYKLVWSKVRNTWVVASEIAKGHGKNASATRERKLLKTAVITAIMGGCLMTGGLASAELTPEQKVVYDAVMAELEKGGGVHYFSVKSKDQMPNYNKDGAKGETSVAIGPGSTTKFRNGLSVGTNNLNEGYETTVVGSLNKAYGLGDSAYAYGATIVGTGNTIMSNKGTLAMGSDNIVHEGIAIGSGNKAMGENAVAMGNYSSAMYTDSMGIGFGAHGEADGVVAIGRAAKGDALAGVAIGRYAEVHASTGVALGDSSISSRGAGFVGYMPGAVGQTAEEVAAYLGKAEEYKSWKEDRKANQGAYDRAKAWHAAVDAERKAHNEVNQARIAYAKKPTEENKKALTEKQEAWKKASDERQKTDVAMRPDFKTINDLNARYGKIFGKLMSTEGAVSVGDEKTGRTRQIINVAAGTKDTDAVNVYQLKALNTKMDKGAIHYFSVKSDDSARPAGTNWNNDGATGNGAVAIGEKAMAAKGGTVSIGRNAHIEGNGGNPDGEGSVAIGDNSLITTNGLDLASIAIGKNAKVLNGSGKQERGLSFTPDNFDKGNTLPKNADKVPGGIAIGTNSYARTGSIQLGHHTFAGYQMGGIDVTKANEEANIVGMTTVGTNTYNKGAFANMYGAYSIITGGFTGAGGYNSLKYGPQNFGANVVGSLNSIRSKGHSGSSGIANSIVGVANTVENANGTLVYGAGNKITNSIKAIRADAGFTTLKSWEDAVTGLQKAIKDSNSGGAVLAIGGGNVADYVQHSQLVGVNNTVTGTENKVSDFNMVNGYQNTGTNITHVTMIGSENTATDSESTLIMGDKQKVTKIKHGVLLGSQDAEKETIVSDVVAVGHNAYVEKEGGIALGSGSIASIDKGVFGYDPFTGKASTETSAIWKATQAAFSVGSTGDKNNLITRQITGVAAGSEDTDAVNVAQLKAVESKITQTGAEAQKHTSVAAGTNISVTEEGTNNEGGKNYKVSLAKDIDLGQDGSIKAGNTIINKDGVTTNTVKAGDTTINNDGVTIKDGPVITKTNVDVNNQQIHHVKDGTADDDAATVGQVNKKIDEITKTVAGSSVTGGTIGEDGKISLTKADKTTVELQGQLKDISARAGDYEIKDNKVTIGLEDNYSKNAAGNIVIKDVAKASALEQETKERKDADKVITETIGAANKDELKTSYQDTTYIKNSTTLVEADKALDKAIGKNAGDIKKNTETINILGKQVGNLDTRVNKVGAGAAALAALHPLDFDPDDKWDFAAGYGNYKGANAAAIGAYYRPNEDTMFSVGGSFGGGENMVNAGVSVKLGQGNHVSTSKVAMAKDMLAMQKRMAEMEAQMAKMQGFIGALTGMDTQAAMFPDVPENHWAYEYVKGLCEKGIIEGYPDGNFNGNRSMTRYEFAAMLYRALAKGVNLDARAVKEFAPELGRIRVDVISQNKEGQPVIERVRVNEEKKEK